LDEIFLTPELKYRSNSSLLDSRPLQSKMIFYEDLTEQNKYKLSI